MVRTRAKKNYVACHRIGCESLASEILLCEKKSAALYKAADFFSKRLRISFMTKR